MFAPTCQRYTSATGWNRNHSECHTCHAKWRPFQTWEHRMQARVRYDARQIVGHPEKKHHRIIVPFIRRSFHKVIQAINARFQKEITYAFLDESNRGFWVALVILRSQFWQNQTPNDMFLHYIYPITGWWLSLPLWKILVRHLGWWHSQYMESHKIYVPKHQELGLHRCAVPISRRFHGWAYRSQHLNCKKQLSSSVLPAINSDILSGMCLCPSMAHCIRSRLHPELAIWSSGLRGEEVEGGTTRTGRRKQGGIAPLSKSRDPHLAGERNLS